MCRLESPASSASTFGSSVYIVNSINGGIDVYGVMECMCWNINFSAEDVRRPDNGSKTLSEFKFQISSRQCDHSSSQSIVKEYYAQVHLSSLKWMIKCFVEYIELL